jgi:GTP cyclohydrolase I
MSFNKTKTDPVLGQEIHKHLLSLGIETPTIDNGLTIKQKVSKIEKHFKSIMETLGLDLTDDSLSETPLRVAKMYCSEIFWGLDPENFPKCTTVDNKMLYNQMLVEEDITIKSFCEHHALPIIGVATVAYIPNQKVLGLSKLNRICEYFSRRPQIQERLTEQIFHALKHILGTDNVAVMIDGAHTCVSMRGVEDETSRTTTSKLGGDFKENPMVRAEFMQIATRIRK